MNFEIGNIVKLKSGGPAMTVIRINEETKEVTTAYFNPADQVAVVSDIPAAALVYFQ